MLGPLGTVILLLGSRAPNRGSCEDVDTAWGGAVDMEIPPSLGLEVCVYMYSHNIYIRRYVYDVYMYVHT